MAKTVKRPLFHYFFCIFSYSESPLAWIFGSQGVSDPFLGGYEGWFVGTLRGSPKKSKCFTRPEGFAPTYPPPLGDTTPAILAGTKRTENSFGIIWPSPRQLRVKNTLRVGHRGPVGRKTTQKPPQNTKKWKKSEKTAFFTFWPLWAK